MIDEKTKKFTVTEKDREFTTLIKSEKFTIRMLLPSQKIEIAARTARVFAGTSRDVISNEDWDLATKIITLNEVIVDPPDDWKGADVCVDEDIINELWKFYNDSKTTFLGSLKKNNKSKDLGEGGKSS